MLFFGFLKTHVFVSYLNFSKTHQFQFCIYSKTNVSSSSQNHRLQLFWGKIKIKEPQVAFTLKETLKNLGFFCNDRTGTKPTVLWPSLEKYSRTFQKLKYFHRKV
jgi:hypothetical protein